jgi:hypothetical protein
MAAAAVAGAKKVKDSPTARNALADVADHLRDAGGGLGKGASRAADAGAGAVTFAVSEAARAFVDALNRRRDEAEEAEVPSAEGWTEAAEPAESKKKPSSYEGVPH